MFEIMIKSPKEFLRILKGVAGIVSCVNVDFTKDGMEIIAIDDGRIGCYKLKISAEDFNGYKIDTEYRLGLDLDTISKMLSMVVDKDVLFLKHDATTPDKINLIIQKEKSQQVIKTSIEEVSDMRISFANLVNICYPVKGVIDLSDLNYAIKMADKIDVKISINADQSGLILRAESQLTTWAQTFPANITEYYAKEPFGNQFAIYLLKKLVAIANPKKATVKLAMIRNGPIQCSIQLLGHSSFDFFIANRDEQDDECDECEANSEERSESQEEKQDEDTLNNINKTDNMIANNQDALTTESETCDQNISQQVSSGLDDVTQ